MELTIENGKYSYAPNVVNEITWTTERKGSPGQLSFSVYQDDILKMTEGNVVRLTDTFYGFLFTRKPGKNGIVQCTAYDQLRYFKNKDTRIYSNKTASAFIKSLAKDFNLNVGKFTDTEWKIASRTEDGVTLFDMVQNALDETLMNTGNLFVLYDKVGKLRLSHIGDMMVGVLIDKDTAQDYSYTISIDSDTYNKIKLYYDNEDTGVRDTFVAQSGANINKWGVLQMYESIEKGENGKAKAAKLLKLYNSKTKTLSVTGCAGDIRVRAGCLIPVQLDLPEAKINNLMLVEKATHKFEKDLHTMDLILSGGGFSA